MSTITHRSVGFAMTGAIVLAAVATVGGYAFDTGGVTPSLTATGVGAGIYFIRVRAKNSAGVSGPSNEILLIVGGVGGACTAAPNPPSGLVGTASGSSVTLTWSAPTVGCLPTGYVLEGGSSPGLSNLANSNTGNTQTTYSASGVGTGTYYVRIRASNAGGTSGPSNEITVTVGGGTGGGGSAGGGGGTISRQFVDTVGSYGYVGHIFNTPVSGLMTATLSWNNRAVDLDLYLTRGTCRVYPIGNCNILVRSIAVNTTSEQVSWPVTIGEQYVIWG